MTTPFLDQSTSGVDEDVLVITTPDTKIRNSAQFKTTGDLSEGIIAFADGVRIENNGWIETSGLGAAGIVIEGNNATIVNSGTVITRGGFFDETPQSPGDELFADGLNVIGDAFHIDNDGFIRVEGEQSSAMSAYGANGVIVNDGRIEAAGASGAIILTVGTGSKAINNGLVKVTAELIDSLLVVGENALALNRGRIEMNAAHSIGIEGAQFDTRAVNEGSIKIVGDQGIGVYTVGDGHELENRGRIEMKGSFSIGMAATAQEELALSGLDARISNSGRILMGGDLSIGVTLGLTNVDGHAGFASAVANGEIFNAGRIQTNGDGAAGVVMVGSGHHLINQGQIVTHGGHLEDALLGSFSAAGVLVSGSETLVENVSGSIVSNDARSAAVELNVLERGDFVAGDATSRLENSGIIKGAALAVLGGAGQETVVNHGLIIGDVDLAGGADIFVFGKSGSVQGNVFLGEGSDLVVVENGAGKAIVADFSAAGVDRIDVRAFFSNYDAVTAKISQHGNDSVINLDQNDTLLLSGVNMAQLSADNFVFG